MALRSTGTTTIAFGLVAVPVKLYAASAESAQRISFNMLHANCGARVRQQYACEKCGEQVEREDSVKGFEYEKGRFVTFTADEIKALEATGGERTDIIEFVFENSVPALYLDKPYYLAPDKGGAPAYALLLEALAKTGREAIAKYTARGNQSVVVIRPQGGVLVMHTLRYGAEVRSEDQVPMDALPAIDPRHLSLACSLIEQDAAAAFDPSKHTDEIRERTLRAIKAKVETGSMATVAETAPRGSVVNLLEALKASLKGA